ncbi:MAG: right-handed parallel beta-helix repeat-containing protein [Myxococcota bacterium]
MGRGMEQLKTKNGRRLILSLWALAALVAATPSEAVDGVFEINQTCATQTGCFPLDAPGLPVEISQPGSYRLTGNLATLNKGTTAILIAADDVHLDLNGFTIACSFSTPAPAGCTAASGQGIGVAADNVFSRERATVRSGTIRDMGSHGVQLGRGTLVENVRIHDNGGIGISLGDNSGGTSEFGGRFSIIRGNSIASNGSAGAFVPNASLIVDNVIESNAGPGLFSLGQTETAYRDNVIRLQSTNVSGIAFRDLGGNYCGGPPCP